MELKKINILGLSDIYSIDVVEKEFFKAVEEKWRTEPPWQRYQKKLLQDLVVLDEYKYNAIEMVGFEKLSTDSDLYSIRHPETPKNVRIIFTFYGRSVILLTAFFREK